MTTQELKKLTMGQNIEVEFWVSKDKEIKWEPAIFNGLVSAIDREVRVNITLPNGVQINECAPECIRVK